MSDRDREELAPAAQEKKEAPAPQPSPISEAVSGGSQLSEAVVQGAEEIPGGFSNAPSVYGVPGARLPEGETYGDWMLRPGKPLKARHKRLAELHALGKTNNEIAEELNYTASRVSILLSNTQVQRESEAYRDKLFDKSVNDRLRDLGPAAVDTIEEMLTSEDEKLRDKVESAKWVIEKLTGKPKQEVTGDSGQTVLQILQALDTLKSAGGPAALGDQQRDVIEMVQGKQAEDDPISRWAEEHTGENK